MNRIIVFNHVGVITTESFIKVFKLIETCKYKQVRMHNSQINIQIGYLRDLHFYNKMY